VHDLAIRYGTAWADRDVEAVVAMHTDDTVYQVHGGGPAVARDNPTMRYLRPALLGVVLLATGCGAMTAHGSGNCSPRHVSVAAARSEQPKQLVRVEGHYLRKNGITRLCDAVMTSGSPRCKGSSLVIRSYEPNPHVAIQHSHDVAWTTGTVKIFGLVSGRTLRVAGCA
jgi:hypothetical protein